jgi:crossover junction endodeoxyribonuclease RuvC
VPLILGVDPGSLKTGYAFIKQVGRQLSVVESGAIRLPSKNELHLRLGQLHQTLSQLIEQHQPDVCAVEDIFAHRNARSALALGQARGVVLAIAGLRELPLSAYPPATVKRAVAGNGRADKTQIQKMVRVLLSLQAAPQEDEADAMAVAMCHALCGRQPNVKPKLRSINNVKGPR